MSVYKRYATAHCLSDDNTAFFDPQNAEARKRDDVILGGNKTKHDTFGLIGFTLGSMNSFYYYLIKIHQLNCKHTNIKEHKAPLKWKCYKAAQSMIILIKKGKSFIRQ